MPLNPPPSIIAILIFLRLLFAILHLHPLGLLLHLLLSSRLYNLLFGRLSHSKLLIDLHNTRPSHDRTIHRDEEEQSLGGEVTGHSAFGEGVAGLPAVLRNQPEIRDVQADHR
jgi:hypothetical protein